MEFEISKKIKGYTIQEGILSTVEHQIFEAFKRTKLIESRETSNYHRCGRTDKGNFCSEKLNKNVIIFKLTCWLIGVSAFCQVISIDFRSNCASGDGNNKLKFSI